jgi:cyclopropane fatty-acyl-phospholipid synthase-like methyltransferase
MSKPYAPSCDRNREPILSVIRPLLADRQRLLELGSGTGQHAAWLAAQMPHLRWQTTERPGHLDGIHQWLADAGLPNTPPPMALDVAASPWPLPAQPFDAAFTANTLHYMPWEAVQALFAQLPQHLSPGALFIAYGPFRIDGQHTSDSNVQFDGWLAGVDPRYAVRDLGEVDALAQSGGLQLEARHAMPANNFCVVWRHTVG